MATEKMAAEKPKREYCKEPAHRKDYRVTFRLSEMDYNVLQNISKGEDKLVSEILRDWVRSKVAEVNDRGAAESGNRMATV